MGKKSRRKMRKNKQKAKQEKERIQTEMLLRQMGMFAKTVGAIPIPISIPSLSHPIASASPIPSHHHYHPSFPSRCPDPNIIPICICRALLKKPLISR